MALTAQPAAHSNWGRWTQQIPQEYNMMGPQGMMVYSSRPPTPDLMTGQMMAQQYMVSNGYAHGQVQAMQVPQYHGTPSYAPYGAQPQPQLVSHPSMSFKPEYHGSMDDRMLGAAPSMGREDVKHVMMNGHLSPPMSRRGSEICMDEEEANPTAKSKIITANETINPGDRVDFDTDVDQLMKALQHTEGGNTDAESQAPSQVFTPMTSPKMEVVSSRSSPVSSVASPASTTGATKTTKPKQFFCDGPNCNKGFSQKTHLDIHKRTHTGDRPYVCKHDGCNLTFSQLGNLKTHERRHTGEKPYKCSICDKTFAQKGNVKSHEETHEGKKPFKCILDGCEKKFSQLGNMKTHQNNFHKEALQDLTHRFIKFTNAGYIPDEFRMYYEYFKQHYKNSNKGIKGRGKARKIAGKDASPRKAFNDKSARQTHKPTTEFAYTTASSPSPMANSIPRSGNFNHGYPMEAHSSPGSQMMYMPDGMC